MACDESGPQLQRGPKKSISQINFSFPPSRTLAFPPRLIDYLPTHCHPGHPTHQGRKSESRPSDLWNWPWCGGCAPIRSRPSAPLPPTNPFSIER
ncbi:ribose-5-phosphate isomerase B [Histoplasma capsulatum G186AR]|uniref:Ribose-5-phosphate isomerase B n=2 Tax=Ajellomyces capsulatus TaxID=5037 RepID=C0NXD1_AJECG|nr:ribose-5-phosphate isomerase B [Histoplasma capsulatum G186AR]EEH03997.1 ribose-5-phosphate isomerase B [Histoplasma capsulatum G186AR]